MGKIDMLKAFSTKHVRQTLCVGVDRESAIDFDGIFLDLLCCWYIYRIKRLGVLY